ncbi:hypothetical protein Tco_0364428 [Tanacetum coccineum]
MYVFYLLKAYRTSFGYLSIDWLQPEDHREFLDDRETVNKADQKAKEFTCKGEQEEVFHASKRLCNAPVLAIPEETENFETTKEAREELYDTQPGDRSCSLCTEDHTCTAQSARSRRTDQKGRIETPTGSSIRDASSDEFKLSYAECPKQGTEGRNI